MGLTTGAKSLEAILDAVAQPADAWAVTWAGGTVKPGEFVGEKRAAMGHYHTAAGDPAHFGEAKLFVCRLVSVARLSAKKGATP